MSERIYTIPACEVVPGMLMYDTVVARVWPEATRGDVQIQLLGGGVFHYVEGETVSVKLPGKSPREAHRETCPDRDLRLRLWPVDAKWNWASQGWLVPVGEHDQAYVLPRDVCNNFVDFMDHAADALRAAFCEPEPT